MTAPENSPSVPEDLIDEAMAWVEADPDPETQRELLDLISRAGLEKDAAEDLSERFSGLLQFGTAGLRGALGAGPHRMNRAVVTKAAAGLSDWLVARAESEGWARARAVVGYDARTKSEAFARDTAAVLTAAEIDVCLMPLPLPTPVLAWAVRLLKADVGVMVTASHNPAADNGYKVYLGNHAVPEDGRGAQIVPPVDSEIAACIEASAPAARIPKASGGWTTLPERVARDYEHQICDLLPGRAPASRKLSVVLTPMHGVGGEIASMALSRAGFDRLRVVPEQALPDPAFPTVAFPNPEEPGALDLAIGLARETEADLVVANDPDADRAAFAVPDAAAEGGWRMLRGDEVGALFGRLVLDRLRAGLVETRGAGPVFANSIVSSRLLGKIAAAHGIAHRETLTGFKWIARVPGLVYGYEEALGYCLAPDLVRDKDGLSAALLLADWADRLASEGRTLLDVLDELALEHGVHATDQLSLRFEDLSRIPELMERLRDRTPEALGGSPVVSVEDLSEGSADLPPTDGLRLLTQDGTRVIVRPSGTEPKLKCYLEAVVPADSPETLAPARAEAARRLQTARTDLSVALGL